MGQIWFDTEFLENGSTIELISIGMVKANGDTLYRETTNAVDLCHKDPWLRKHVEPQLWYGDSIRYRNQIRDDIVNFVGPNPEFWSYYGAYDWVALCQLFGRMNDLPKGWPMYCRDLKQLCDSLGNPKLVEHEQGEHFALADAVWVKKAYYKLQLMAIPDKSPV